MTRPRSKNEGNPYSHVFTTGTGRYHERSFTREHDVVAHCIQIREVDTTARMNSVFLHNTTEPLDPSSSQNLRITNLRGKESRTEVSRIRRKRFSENKRGEKCENQGNENGRTVKMYVKRSRGFVSMLTVTLGFIERLNFESPLRELFSTQFNPAPSKLRPHHRA